MLQTRKAQVIVAIVTLIGAAIYVARSLYIAHSAISIADEGTYLFKGLYFARGDYQLFQENGFWTNKSPLSFLIPGYIQLWFGPGLRVGRYFAILVSVLTLAGLWISTNRLAGRNWAAVAVWVLALSDAHTSTYSLALSQGLVACLISWMCVCVVGDNRPRWQLVAGSILAVLAVMTRQNMVAILPLLVLYIFWQYGRYTGYWILGMSVILFAGFHALYWPGILQLWAPWLPPSVTPFLDEFRIHAVSGVSYWDIENLSRLQSVVRGLRDHFFLIGGFVGALILFPPSRDWKSTGSFKTAVFLGVTFAALFLMHIWGSVFNAFCVQCFTSYQLFYSVMGFLFIVTVFSNGLADSMLRRVLLFAVLIIFSAGIGLHYFQPLGDWTLANLQIPRLNRLFIDDGKVWVSLAEVLTNISDVSMGIQRRIASALTGAMTAILLFVVISIVHWFVQNKMARKSQFSVNAVLNMFLIIGVILPPIAEAGATSTPCSTNFLTYYEELGYAISEAIPPNSQVFWKGSGRHIALMLYVDDIRIFAPQINAGGGYFVAGDRDHMLRFGIFDDAINAEWSEMADVFIIWDGYPNTSLDDFENDPEYERIPYEMGGLALCEEPLHLFRRTQ